MWTAIIAGATKLTESFFERKRVEQQAKADAAKEAAASEGNYDLQAQKNMQMSWKDEYLMIVFTAPLLLGYFDEERALAWIDFVGDMPLWYQIILFGMVAATFGLRWWFSKKRVDVLLEKK